MTISEYHDKLSNQFLVDYSEILPIVIDLRSKGFSMQQIANELNKLGFLTREKKHFSSVQVFRILQRVRVNDSSQMIEQQHFPKMIPDQLPLDVEQLKIKISMFEQQYSGLRIEIEQMKSELYMLKTKNRHPKVKQLFSDKLTEVSTQHDTLSTTQTEKLKQVDSIVKVAILQQARQLHITDSKLSKSNIAKRLAEKFNIRSETIRGWIKKEW